MSAKPTFETSPRSSDAMADGPNPAILDASAGAHLFSDTVSSRRAVDCSRHPYGHPGYRILISCTETLSDITKNMRSTIDERILIDAKCNLRPAPIRRRRSASAMSEIERIAILIDGPSLHASQKSLGFEIDYTRLLQHFRIKGRLVRAIYYTLIAEDQEYSSLRPLLDWLSYNGYSVVMKPGKEVVDGNGRKRLRGSMDVDLTVDALEIAERIDHIYLFSGNGDLRAMVAGIQRKGVRVTVVAAVSSRPPQLSDELRRQSDETIDLATLASSVGKAAAPTPVESSTRQEPARIA